MAYLRLSVDEVDDQRCQAQKEDKHHLKQESSADNNSAKHDQSHLGALITSNILLILPPSVSPSLSSSRLVGMETVAIATVNLLSASDTRTNRVVPDIVHYHSLIIALAQRLRHFSSCRPSFCVKKISTRSSPLIAPLLSHSLPSPLIALWYIQF